MMVNEANEVQRKRKSVKSRDFIAGDKEVSSQSRQGEENFNSNQSIPIHVEDIHEATI